MPNTPKYNHRKIEKKWQKFWEKQKIYKTPDQVKGKDNFYHLVMFPYPSGDLHIGHWYNFAPADVYARFKRMQGFNVMSPIGFDSFGLPAENAALKKKINPRDWTRKNIEKMRKQLKSMGNCYDWSREIITSKPEYYKWTQWMFLKFHKAGLAYKAKMPCNFCPSCKTVLANEQVVGGLCERCDSRVLQKEIEQWFFRISDFTEDLLRDLNDLDWPQTTKIMQRNWIGKSEGWQIEFKIKDLKFPHSLQKTLPVFTTRVDTLFGCTYLVLAPEHPIIKNLESGIKNLESVKKYIMESKKKTERERISEIKEKTGVELKGLRAVNPVNNREIPVFLADYVLMNYGTGAIMAVPAHDQRDFDFAKGHNLPIIEVISGGDIGKKAYEGEGDLINSDRFTGLFSVKAKERIGEWLVKNGLAQKKVCYRLRDWLISRQRYWGVPIPMVFCEKCGWQRVPEKDLPVLLPQIKDYKPSGKGQSPLAKDKKFVKAVCPKCKGPAQRETDTMDTFVCSSWYYLRYADPHNDKRFAAKNKIKKWLPVRMYIGGAEHTVLHLLYSRFFTKVLNKIGYLNFKEPFLSLRHQGIILGKDSQKMSKSKGNVVDPDEQVKKYGSDAVRMYLCFMGPYNQGGPWQPNGIVGVYRFLNRIYDLINSKQTKTSNDKNPKLEKLLHRTIKKVTEDIENFRFNTAISALMILVNEMQGLTYNKENNYLFRTLLLLLAPFAPHLAEELWQKCQNYNVERSIHSEKWPQYDPKLLKEEKVQLIVQINGRVRDKVEVFDGISEAKAKELTFGRENVKKWIGKKEVKKVVFVPNKIINIVI